MAIKNYFFSRDPVTFPQRQKAFKLLQKDVKTIISMSKILTLNIWALLNSVKTCNLGL